MSSSSKKRGSSSKLKTKAAKKKVALIRLPSNIGVFRDLVKNRLQSLLNDNHYEALRQTPFFHFINLPAIPNEQVAVDCLLHAFNPERSSFTIGGKDIVFSVLDVHEITGLPKTGNRVVMDGRASNTIYTEHVYCKKTQTEEEEEKKASRRKKRKADKKDENKDKKKVWGTRKRMTDLIVELADSNHIACVKLLVAFIIGFVLCPQPANSCPLWAFRYADNLFALHNYNWAGAVYDLLHKEMTKAKLSISKRAVGERGRAGYMGGFASVLVVWFYEIVRELKYEIKEEALRPIFIERKSRSHRRKAMMRLIEKPKCIRNFTSQTTISSIPSVSLHQPGMTLLQVRELLAKNRQEYDELIELEKKLSSGGNEEEDEEEDEDDSEDDDKEEEDGEDEDDGDDENDEEDEDDDDTNFGENEVEDDEANRDNVGGQRHEEKTVDKERSEKSSGRSKSRRKEKQSEISEKELVEDDDYLAISFSGTTSSKMDIKDRTPSIKRVVRDRKHVPARAYRSPYTRLRGRNEKKKDIINVSQLQTPNMSAGSNEKNEVINVSQLQTPKKRKKVNKEIDFIPKNCDYPAKEKLNDSERKVLDEFCKKRMNRYNL